MLQKKYLRHLGRGTKTNTSDSITPSNLNNALWKKSTLVQKTMPGPLAQQEERKPLSSAGAAYGRATAHSPFSAVSGRPCSPYVLCRGVWQRPCLCSRLLLQLQARREPQPRPPGCAEVRQHPPRTPAPRSAPGPHSASAHTCAPALCLEGVHCFYTKRITINASSKVSYMFITKTAALNNRRPWNTDAGCTILLKNHRIVFIGKDL